MDECDFVYLSVKESLMRFDVAYGNYIGKYGLTCSERTLFKRQLLDSIG